MKLEIILIFVTLWLRTETYDVRCPDPSEWNHRATVNCSADKHYICLYNDLDDFYSESCDVKYYISRKGRRRVKSPAINEVNCTSDRYQPLLFTTSCNSDCVLYKSFCNGEGQVIANNGSTTTDTACRCDYTKGYVYVTTPGDVCSCFPSMEDCACYKQNCPVGQKLTADYRCINTDQSAVQRCAEIGESTDKGTDKLTPLIYVDNISKTRSYAGNAASGALILILIYIVLLMLLFINVRPYIIKTEVVYSDDLIIDKCESTFTYTVFAGGDLTIKWNVKSMFTVKSIICQKDGEEKSTKDIYTVNVSDKLTAVSVTIHKLESEDRGIYTCFVTDVHNLTNNYGDQCLNIVPCKGSMVRLGEYMQNVPIIRWNGMNPVKIIVCNLPTTVEEYICIKGQSINLEIKSKQNIKSVKWYQRTTRNLLVPLTNTSNKYHDGTSSIPSLVIKSTGMEDAGAYICLINGAQPEIFGMKLKVMLQEKLCKDILHHRKDLLFTKISAVEIAYKCLHDHGMVYIIGREGTGKSALCLELASLCVAKDMVPIKMDIKNINNIEMGEYKTLYIIDDILNNTHNREHFQKLFTVNCPHSAKLPWIVISCRTSEWLFLQNALKGIEKFKEECLIQLDNCLTEEDKRKIVAAYFRAHNIVKTTHAESNYYHDEILSNDTIQVKIDKEAVKKIIQTEPYYGFPLTTVLFCQDRKRLHMGEKYFTAPPMFILSEMKEIYRLGKEEQKEEQMSEYCVLVYIGINECLMLTSANTKQYMQIKNIAFNSQSNLGDNTNLQLEIANAANRMSVKYLTYFDGKYTFIHPYLLKALMMSSDYCAHFYLIQHGSFDVIEEFVRSVKYEPRKEELIHKLTDTMYVTLCERLVDDLFDCINEANKRDKIYSYIYKEYIQLRDTVFLTALMNRIQAVSYTNQYKDSYKTGSACKIHRPQTPYDTQTQLEPSTPTKYLSAWQIMILLDKLTNVGKDPWIYCNQTLPDVIIICGLIAACKHKYLSNSEQKSILTLLRAMLKSEVDKKSPAEGFNGILDDKGNTFFHYLTIFSEPESCFIFGTDLSGDLLKYCYFNCGKPNTAGCTPPEMAAFMGKGKLLKLFLSNQLEKKKHLLQFAKDGKCHDTKEPVTKFKLSEHFEEWVIRSSECGLPEDYDATFSLLND